jgi:Fur family transcriptional regulator, stress-responsive regulator
VIPTKKPWNRGVFANRSRSAGYRSAVIEGWGEPEVVLRSYGLRVTQPRLAVAAVLARARNEEEHLTVAEVVERCREIHAKVSPQTVYDCLEVMTAAGAVRRVDLPGSPARFEARVGDGHHHHVCQRCGAVHNIAVARPGPHDVAPDVPTGTRIDRTEVVYWGTCADCAGRA